MDPAAAVIAVLLFTLPAQQQAIFVNAEGDSEIVCDATDGPPLRELRSARLYWEPVTGGGFRFHHEHDVTGREGQADTMQVERGPGGHAFVTTFNPRGESCVSTAIVYVPGSQVTGVPVDGSPDELLDARYFNVRGEYVGEYLDDSLPSGVYLEQRVYAGGRVVTRKHVVVK